MSGPPHGPTPPAGWFPDPTVPGQLRYWDGNVWTAATHASPVQAVAPPAHPASWYPDPSLPGWMRWWDGTAWAGDPRPQPGLDGQPAGYGQPYPYASAVTEVRAPTGPVLTTADGTWFELAGWWRRAGGLLLDWLIVGVPFAIVSGLLIAAVAPGRGFSVVVGLGDRATTDTGGVVALRIALVLAQTAVTFAYAVWLIGSQRQTWGMQAVGVTAVDVSGRALTRRQVWMRALYRVLFISLWVDLLTIVTVLDGQRHPAWGTATSTLQLALDLVVYLWVLGSPRNQTLIDKVTGSIVVRGTRVAGAPVAAPWAGGGRAVGP
jgi:uncharacterized RDD family membrane protein YckC